MRYLRRKSPYKNNATKYDDKKKRMKSNITDNNFN